MNPMLKGMRYLVLTLVFVLAGLPVLSGDLTAQDAPATSEETTGSARFSLHPAADPQSGFINDLEIAPGASSVVDVIVQNSSDSPVDLRLYMTNAGNASNGGFRSGTPEEEKLNQTTWIEFETQELSLQGNEQQVVSLTVNVPEEAEPGQYITALVAETADPIPIPGSTEIDQRIRYAMAIGVLVPGEIQTSFDLGEPSVEDSNLTIPITNTGNYLVIPSGQLQLSNDSGEEVVNTEFQMNSVYTGNSTDIVFSLPEQLESGNYVLNLSLKDAESEASSSIEDAEVFVPIPVDPTGISIGEYSLTPNADPIVYMDVSALVSNGGSQLPAANVVLEVSRDGELVEEFTLANNQVLLSGDNQIDARYIPADGNWEPGTYSFTIVVSSVNTHDDQQVVLLTQPLEEEVVVP